MSHGWPWRACLMRVPATQSASRSRTHSKQTCLRQSHRQIKTLAEIQIPRAFSVWWGKKDSNLRSHTAADLQSAPFATRDTPPLSVIRPVRSEAVGQPTKTFK